MSRIDNEDQFQTDARIRSLYKGHARPSEPGPYLADLQARATARRRPASRLVMVRRLGIALAGLVVVLGLGFGIWQAYQHLDRDGSVVVIGDATGIEPSGETQSTSSTEVNGIGFTSAEPGSVDDIEFADIWVKAAAALGIDPESPRIENIQVNWRGDGRLISFHLTGAMPDGRQVSLGANPELIAGSGSITVRGAVRDQSDVGHFGPQPRTMLVFEVLSELDQVGLQSIAEASGIEITGDPAALREIAREQGLFGPPDDPSSSGPGGVATGVYLTLSNSYRNLGDANNVDQLRAALHTQIVLDVDRDVIDRLDVEDLASVSFPVHGLALGRIWEFTDPARGNRIIFSSDGFEAAVLLHPASDEHAASPQLAPQVAVDTALDGLAFVSPEESIEWVREGEVATVWRPSTRYAGIGQLFGVAYSLGHQWLLYGAGIVEVTENGVTSDEFFGGPMGNARGDGGNADGRSYSWRSQNEAALLRVSVDGGDEAEELLRYDSMPRLDRIRYDETTGQVWVSGPTDGPSTVLFSLLPPYTKPQLMTLGSDFDGDYAVSPDGSTLVYLDCGESPVWLTLRVAEQEERQPLPLETAYDPAFSPDGSKICLVGSDSVTGKPSLWIYDTMTGTCVPIEGSEGLTPTYPAFSPDGRTIAFRNWSLGDLWTIPVEGGNATRYDLPLAEAPISW